jgi:hypothetical protein
MAVFWVVAPCSLVEVYQRFRGPCCLHHQGDEYYFIFILTAVRTSDPKCQNAWFVVLYVLLSSSAVKRPVFAAQLATEGQELILNTFSCENKPKQLTSKFNANFNSVLLVKCLTFC